MGKRHSHAILASSAPIEVTTLSALLTLGRRLVVLFFPSGLIAALLAIALVSVRRLLGFGHQLVDRFVQLLVGRRAHKGLADDALRVEQEHRRRHSNLPLLG